METIDQIAGRVRAAATHEEGNNILRAYNDNACEAYRSMCRFADEETVRANRAEDQLASVAALVRALAQSEPGDRVDLSDWVPS